MKKVKRIDSLTDEQRDQMDAHADKWIEIGLRTGKADRKLFESSAEQCYNFAEIKWHGNVLWVDNPLHVAIIGPTLDWLVSNRKKIKTNQKNKLDKESNFVVDVFNQAILSNEENLSILKNMLGDADILQVLTCNAVDIAKNIKQKWHCYVGGQFWLGGWYYGGSSVSFFREVCGLELEGNLDQRAIAYENTIKSACWWWPHTDFLVVSERPQEIHRELTDPNVTRGWNSHRLHNESGPAVSFRGLKIYYIHGVQVPEYVVEQPELITPEKIDQESNAEVKRIMINIFGPAEYLQQKKAKELHKDRFGTLYMLPLEKDDPLMVVKVINRTAEPDGSFKEYFLPVHHELRPLLHNGELGEPQELTAKNAVASTWGRRGEDFDFAFES